MNRKSKPPKISVIMPAYNVSEYIRDAIESFLIQSYTSTELIIVNDGSTDDLKARIKDLVIQNKNISYIEQENRGVSAARNLAIKYAKGDWIAFLDADDIWYKNKLSIQMQAIGDCVWSHSDSHYFGLGYENNPKRSDLSEMFEGNIFLKLLEENFITTSSILIRKETLLKFGGFDENMEALEDWRLWLSIAKNYPISLVKKPLLKYRMYPSSTSKKARKMLPLHLQVVDSALNELDIKNRLTIKKRAYFRVYMILSFVAQYSDDLSFALYCAYKALLNRKLSFAAFRRILTLIYAIVFKKIK